MKRRDFLTRTGATIAAAPFVRVRAAQAQPKPEKIVMMTWGGLWGDSMRAGVDTAFEKATGVKVVQDRSGSPVERITKLKIGLDNQNIDIVQIHDGLVPLAVKQGVFEPIDAASPRLGNLKDIYPQF